MRRLRVRSTQPDLRGSRETLPGPTTWVRPATGWWGRMNAGETPRNQGRSVWPPLSVSRRRSRDLRKTPQWSAERRAGPRYGPAIPSADGRGPIVRRANGCGVPRPRISALRFPLLGVRRVRNRQFGTTVRRDAPRGHAPPRVKHMDGEGNEDVEVCADDSQPSCPALCRASTPWRRCKAWMAGTSPAMTNVGFWRSEPEAFGGQEFWRNEPEFSFGGTNPRTSPR
jgi:hypothetical protein